MKYPFLCLIVLSIISCTNTNQSGPNENENARTTDTLAYSHEELGLIKRADSVCRVIDAESASERVEDDTFVDRDGQTYLQHYKGYTKSSSDSIIKVLASTIFSEKNSATATVYYYNGTIIKGITEIFADDTVKVVFYYDAEKMIYPKKAGMEEAAEKLRQHSISWRTYFQERQSN